MADTTAIAAGGAGMRQSGGRPSDSGRQRPDYFSAYGNGLGIVPRRGWDFGTSRLLEMAKTRGVEGLHYWAVAAPARLIQVLCDTHPMFGQARSNDIALAFAPGDTHIVAVARQTNPDGTSTEKIDADGTAALDALWDALPPEVGGLLGLQSALYDQAMTCGLTCLEAVPGPGGSGLMDAATFNPMTCRFRDTPDGRRILEQNQRGEWTPIDRGRCLAVPLHGTRDNPYGRPGRGHALGEGLRDLADQGKLDDVMTQVAWPRLSVGFPFEQVVQFAKDNPDLLIGQGKNGRDATPAEWAGSQFKALSALITSQDHADTFVRIKGAEAVVLSGASGLKALEGTFEYKRLRLVQALDQLPTLMGIDPGGTLAFSSTQWRAQAKKLEWLRAFVNGVIVRLATLHLRYLGLGLSARADVEPIQTSDALADQQARRIQIANEYRLVDEGAQTDEEAAVNLTGSGPVGPRKTDGAGNPPPPPGPPTKDTGDPV